MTVKNSLIYLTVFFASLLHGYGQQLKLYPPPAAMIYALHNDDYTVKVRLPGGAWQDLYEYNVMVDMDTRSNASMVYFDMAGEVEIAVKKNNGNFKDVRIRPLADPVKTRIQDNTVYFTLAKPRNISVEFDGDKLHNLHLFANPPEQDVPDANDPNVVYFGPGVHEPSDKEHPFYRIKSGQTVYLDGGAVVKGKLLCDSVRNVTIRGRGILYQPQRGIEVTRSSQVTIDGIIILNPRHYTVFGGASDHLTINNIKSFSIQGWSDGIDLMSCSDVKISNVFMRNSDDCIAIYGHRWEYYGDARNYEVSNSVLWADIAHPINIGLHGDTQKGGDTIENLHFRDIDILEHDEDDSDYQGAMAMSVGDLNLVRNVTFENISVDDFQEGKLFSLRCFYNKKYNTGPGRGIEHVTFRNIRYSGQALSESVINGYDADHLVRDVLFENIYINGKKIKSSGQAQMTIGDFARDITFK